MHAVIMDRVKMVSIAIPVTAQKDILGITVKQVNCCCWFYSNAGKMYLTYQWLSTHLTENGSMPGDECLNPARDRNISFIFRELRRKPLVSYSHISIIVSKALLAKIIYILFTT